MSGNLDGMACFCVPIVGCYTVQYVYMRHVNERVCVWYAEEQSWALAVFFNLINNKKLFFCIFYQVNNLFLHQSYLKSPLPVKVT